MINLMPTWLSIALIMCVLVTLAFTVFIGLRRFFVSFINEGNADVLSTTVKTSTLLFGFFMGFVMTILWQAFEKADDFVTQEAGHLSVVVSDSYGLGDQDGERVRRAVGDYIRDLRTKEWPAMRLGHTSPQASASLVNLYGVAQSLHPSAEVEKRMYDSLVKHIKSVYEARQSRIAYLNSPVSEIMRIFVVLAYLTNVILIALIVSLRHRMHLALTMIFGMVVSFNIAIAANLDFPFSGDIAVTSQAFVKGNLAQLSG